MVMICRCTESPDHPSIAADIKIEAVGVLISADVHTPLDISKKPNSAASVFSEALKCFAIAPIQPTKEEKNVTYAQTVNIADAEFWIAEVKAPIPLLPRSM